MNVHRPVMVIPSPLGNAVADIPYWFVIGGQAVRCFCPYRPSRDVDFGVGSVEFDFDVNTEAVQNLLVLIVIILVGLIVIAVALVLFVRSVRERVTTIWRQVREALRVIRSPERLLRLFGGNLLAEITFASVLGLSLLAYGEEAPIMSLLVINVCVGLLAWVMPAPGGLGVSEAALTAGLIAIGIPESTAFAAAITTRLCTFYLPPIWGYFAMQWLRNNRYL